MTLIISISWNNFYVLVLVDIVVYVRGEMETHSNIFEAEKKSFWGKNKSIDVVFEMKESLI